MWTKILTPFICVCVGLGIAFEIDTSGNCRRSPKVMTLVEERPIDVIEVPMPIPAPIERTAPDLGPSSPEEAIPQIELLEPLPQPLPPVRVQPQSSQPNCRPAQRPQRLECHRDGRGRWFLRRFEYRQVTPRWERPRFFQKHQPVRNLLRGVFRRFGHRCR